MMAQRLVNRINDLDSFSSIGPLHTRRLGLRVSSASFRTRDICTCRRSLRAHQIMLIRGFSSLMLVPCTCIILKQIKLDDNIISLSWCKTRLDRAATHFGRMSASVNGTATTSPSSVSARNNNTARQLKPNSTSAIVHPTTDNLGV